MKKVVIGILLSLTIGAPLSAFAVGAIAVDDAGIEHANDVGYWIATGKDSESSAKKAALKDCKNDGNNNCRIAVTFATCGAYAISKKRAAWGTGKTEDEASNAALDACSDKACRIVVAVCD